MPTSTELPLWQENFKQSNYWYGGDAGISTTIGTNRIFIMGRSFWAPANDRRRYICYNGSMPIITWSSVGVQSTSSDTNPLGFLSGAGGGDFFPKSGTDYFRPNSLFQRGSYLYILGTRLRPNACNPAYQIKTTVFRVNIVSTPYPGNWVPTEITTWPQLPLLSSGYSPGGFVSNVFAGPFGTYIFAFGYSQDPGNPNPLIVYPTLMRTLITQFDAGSPVWEYWNGTAFVGNTTHFATNPNYPSPPAWAVWPEVSGSIYSVHYDGAIFGGGGSYVATYSPSYITGEVKMRFGVEPRGPWDAGSVVFKPACMTPGNSQYIPHTVAYDVVKHGVPSTPNLFSVCNTNTYNYSPISNPNYPELPERAFENSRTNFPTFFSVTM